MSKRQKIIRWNFLNEDDIVENSATDTEVTLCIGTELSFNQFNQIGLNSGLRIGVDVKTPGRMRIYSYDTSTYETRISQRNARLSIAEELSNDKNVNLINFVKNVIPTLAQPTFVTVNNVKFLKFKCANVLDEELIIVQNESKGDIYLSGGCSHVTLLVEAL